MQVTLDTPVQYLKGIGPKRSKTLAGEGILTAEDLLERPPFRYEDRSEFRPIASLRAEDWALVRGRVCSASLHRPRGTRISIFEMLVRDESGSIRLKFFNLPYLRKVFEVGQTLVAYGQAKRDAYAQGALVLMSPECEILEEESGPSVHTGRVVPVYRKLGDLRPRTLRQILHTLVSSLPGDVPDPLPAYLRRRLRLMPRIQAFLQVHFPELKASTAAGRARELEVLNRGLSPAHKRLIFEELFYHQVGIGLVREQRVGLRKHRSIFIDDSIREAIKRVLPFHPTTAQKRVLREIVEDMRSSRPMSRLLQGDVGSGKTIVAAQAAIIAVENGFQVAVMAPTEILAEQHVFNFRRLLAPLRYTVDLLKGGLRAAERRETLRRIESGESQIAIGTHALIQAGVTFKNLALVVIDEQHRFGVIQRSSLKEKGHRADLLVMTATPIPRSLALTLYGDLDVSVIDEMPPGRKPIETRLCAEKDRREIYGMMKRSVEAGRQVYVVYPLVEESRKSDLRAATEMAQQLQGKVFPQYRVGLLHGQMKSAEKESVMTAFAAGELQILVSTTVIEVGVDVPNADLMVIEHAERFGLAQLHQLRGRVGRGSEASRCILIGNSTSGPEARKRLQTLCDTNDGFRIAEVDLELRGPGEVAGTRQSGIPAFTFANIVRDRRALEVAREEATRFVQRLRALPEEEVRRVRSRIRRRQQDQEGIGLVG